MRRCIFDGKNNGRTKLSPAAAAAVYVDLYIVVESQLNRVSDRGCNQRLSEM